MRFDPLPCVHTATRRLVLVQRGLLRIPRSLADNEYSLNYIEMHIPKSRKIKTQHVDEKLRPTLN